MNSSGWLRPPQPFRRRRGNTRLPEPVAIHSPNASKREERWRFPKSGGVAAVGEARDWWWRRMASRGTTAGGDLLLTRMMKGLGLLAVLAALVAVSGVAGSSALASDCNNGQYWNLTSRYHDPGTGAACPNSAPGIGESETSTFGGGYSTIRGFCATNGGKLDPIGADFIQRDVEMVRLLGQDRCSEQSPDHDLGQCRASRRVTAEHRQRSACL